MEKGKEKAPLEAAAAEDEEEEEEEKEVEHKQHVAAEGEEDEQGGQRPRRAAAAGSTARSSRRNTSPPMRHQRSQSRKWVWDYDYEQQQQSTSLRSSLASPVTSPTTTRRRSASASSPSSSTSSSLSLSDFYPLPASSSSSLVDVGSSWRASSDYADEEAAEAYNTLACLQMMKGELDIWHVVQLLNKHRQPIFQDFLCGELRSFRDNELEYFLPQLCNLLLHTHSLPLERFLLDLCRRYVHIALRIYFFMKGAVEDDLPATHRKAKYLIKRVLHIVGPSADKVIQHFWESELTMIKGLTRLASSLYDIPKDKQNAVLRTTLHQLNCRLPMGLYLPVVRLNDTYSYIVNIVAEDAFCLGTKARVPYMLFAEMVRVPGVMYSTMENKFRQIQSDNQMSLRPIPSHQPFARNTHIPQTPAYLAVMGMLKEINENAVANLLQQALHISGDVQLGRRSSSSSSAPSSPKTQIKDPADQLVKSPPSSPHTPTISEPLRSMSGVVARITHKRPKTTESTQNQRAKHENYDGSVIQVRMDDDDEDETDNEENEKERKPSKTKASPHLRTLAEGGKQLLKFISSHSNLHDLKDGSRSEERRRRIRPKHTAISLAYRELWQARKKRIQELSSFGTIEGWNLAAVIIKSEDDLRQEQLAMQLIKCAANIFELKQLPLYLRPYEITAVSSSAGMIEVIPDAVSIDSIKRRFFPSSPSLLDYFTRTYGRAGSRSFNAARNNFVESVAGYSLMCYLLQIRDRHNGNILLDVEGHLIHIDYGFILGIAPGWWKFETAPFKLTGEYIELMGGFDSESYRYYEALFIKGFMQLRKYHSRFIQLIEMMMEGNKIPCISETTLPELEERFKLTMSKEDVVHYVKDMIRQAYGSWTTASYDEYQKWTNGILY